MGLNRKAAISLAGPRAHSSHSNRTPRLGGHPLTILGNQLDERCANCTKTGDAKTEAL